MKKIEGIYTALVTPFNNGNIDEESFVKLVKTQVADGVSGFVINGTTGESPTLEIEEVKKLYKLARVTVGESFPLVLGAGLNNTKKNIELMKQLEDLKPAAWLCVVPYYNKPSQEGLFQHFAALADSTNIPILLYNVPGRTITSLAVETIARLAKHKNIIGIKEASGDLTILEKGKALTDKDFIWLSGDDGTATAFNLKGGDGCISVGSHIVTKEFVQLDIESRKRNLSSVQQAELLKRASLLNDLWKWLYIEPNPVPVKWFLYKMGMIRSAEMRLPLVSLDEKFHQGVLQCLSVLKIQTK